VSGRPSDEGALPVVIAGHVDHGKSTLIGRLLYDSGTLSEDRYTDVVNSSSDLGKITEFAFLLDSFAEERSRGISIDTSQIQLRTGKRQYLIIDAPGHREFIKNMVTGASYAESAIVIVDVNEGIREQTKRHVHLLGMVGIRDICVVVNKMDLVGYAREPFERLRDGMRRLLSELSLELRAAIPVCAISGVNVASPARVEMPWYEGPTLIGMLDGLEFRTFGERPFRFPVQDVLEIAGERILVGRVESGEAKPGMGLSILPRRENVSVGSVRKYPLGGIERGSCGESIGIVLDGAGGATRGDVLVEGTGARITRDFSARVFWFASNHGNGDGIRVRCTTQEADGRMTLVDKVDPADIETRIDNPSTLEIGEIATVRIRTSVDLVVDAFSDIPETGRFILEKEGIPVGGGIVV
jgi:bifunctional enzyme CysN/CysC/sulfate adenylyltransferase subunit 1